MTSEQLYDLQMLGAHIMRYCTALTNYRLMCHTMTERADRMRRMGITNPMPAIEKEIDETFERLRLERMSIDTCLVSLELPELPEYLNEEHLDEFLTV